MSVLSIDKKTLNEILQSKTLGPLLICSETGTLISHDDHRIVRRKISIDAKMPPLAQMLPTNPVLHLYVNKGDLLNAFKPLAKGTIPKHRNQPSKISRLTISTNTLHCKQWSGDIECSIHARCVTTPETEFKSAVCSQYLFDAVSRCTSDTVQLTFHALSNGVVNQLVVSGDTGNEDVELISLVINN